MRVAVIGCGYLGAVHAAALASVGHDVVGIEVDEHRVGELAAGRAPFFEPGLEALLAESLERPGRLSFSSRIRDAASAEVVFVCVGTPTGADGTADLSALHGAFAELLPHVAPGAVIAGKSTVPVGTAAGLAERCADAGAVLAWNPEFLREGHAIADTLRPDRIVVGVDPAARGSDAAVAALRAVYAPVIDAGAPFVVTDLATAELAKGAANAFLATKVSFMNLLADVAAASGADVTELAGIMGLDPRIGSRYLNAGIGYGGGCLPKDLQAFVTRADELGLGTQAGLLREVDALNERRPAEIADRAVAMLAAAGVGAGELPAGRVAVLGAAFKPDSDDVRESPALRIAELLHARGLDVVVTDPAAVAHAAAKAPELVFESDLDSALRGADLVLVATEWAEYRALDPGRAGGLVSRCLMLDGRNCLDAPAWRAAGWTYVGIGRRSSDAGRDGTA
ncbi:UDP-glucose/GDP-mannose dehydrogenase family protein [Leucobacter zeae]|nr:UDP-glucose/GDP-mannose dehydrogenase family protein [Leucobacter zeae]